MLNQTIPIFLILLIFIISINASSSNDNQCIALVLSGGASKGVYEVGVLKQLIETLPSEKVQYDVVSGVSAGSINTAFISLFEKGKEQEMIDYMYDYY